MWACVDKESSLNQQPPASSLPLVSILKTGLIPMCVVHAFNSSTQETKADRHLRIRGQLGLHIEFQDNQGYRVKLCLKTVTTATRDLLTLP